jgi:DNA polymerase
MGATAARGVFRRQLTLSRTRGVVRPLDDVHGLATVHPSYLLRFDDVATKRRAWNAFVGDLAVAREWLAVA